jgi:hypothetical protein
MKSSLSSPTPAQQRRFSIIQQIGCLCCRVAREIVGVACDIHHVLSAGKRISHDAAIGICPWHHRGVRPPEFRNDRAATAALGPSRVVSPAAFRKMFGSDEALLERQNRLIRLYEDLAA